MNPLLQEAIGSILRHFITFGAAYFVTRGIWTEESAAMYVSGLTVAILALAWSLWQKHSSRLKLVTALGSDTRMSEQQVETRINAGLHVPSVSTPKEEVPAA